MITIINMTSHDITVLDDSNVSFDKASRGYDKGQPVGCLGFAV